MTAATKAAALAGALALSATGSSWWNDPGPGYADPRPQPAAVPELREPELAWIEMDADVLADVALGEDRDALEAVMWVVINRAQADGKSITEAVQTGKSFGSAVGGSWQPSWRSVPGRRWRHYPAEWRRAQEAAWRVLIGLTPDPTGGATHFHRLGSWTPPWAPDPDNWSQHGAHVFYAGA